MPRPRQRVSLDQSLRLDLRRLWCGPNSLLRDGRGSRNPVWCLAVTARCTIASASAFRVWLMAAKTAVYDDEVIAKLQSVNVLDIGH
jgi:hypothetical protein